MNEQPKKTVLVVDDEEDMVYAVALQLEAAGYEVLKAYTGQEALEKARQARPDAIILDLMLPKIDGYRVCRMLKFDEKYRHIPIILLTARAQDADKNLGYEVGADVYVTKPFDPQSLLRELEQLLN